MVVGDDPTASRSDLSFQKMQDPKTRTLFEESDDESTSERATGGDSLDLDSNSNSSTESNGDWDDIATSHGNGSAKTPTPQSRARSSVNECDVLLASDLNKLSFAEREMINDEIHGIGVEREYSIRHGVVEETSAMLEESFRALAEELEKLRQGGHAPAFDRCQQLLREEAAAQNETPNESKKKKTKTKPTPCYVNEQDFRILFLRCERFDIAKAARRLCAYMDFTRDLFGDKVLRRRIRLSDMTDSEIDHIEKGYTQLVPGRDRAGRRVYVHTATDNDMDNTEFTRAEHMASRMRICVFMVMALLEGDVKSQQLGIVCLFFFHYARIDEEEFTWRSKSQSKCVAVIPLRVGAAHYCFPTEEYSDLSLIMKKVQSETRSRVRVHTGE